MTEKAQQLADVRADRRTVVKTAVGGTMGVLGSVATRRGLP